MTREHFSATERQEPTRGSLGEVLSNDTEDRLVRTLDRIDEHVRAVRRADADLPTDPAILEQLARAAARQDAPFEVRWLAERVETGELHWSDVWIAPETLAGGMWLWSRVVSDLAGATGGGAA